MTSALLSKLIMSVSPLHPYPSPLFKSFFNIATIGGSIKNWSYFRALKNHHFAVVYYVKLFGWIKRMLVFGVK